MSEYPELITINDVDYEINSGYRYALACFSCINDPDLNEYARALGVIGILYKEEPEDLHEALRMAIKYLQCGKEKTDSDQKPDMDFQYDESYIKSSFMSDYRIDLDDTDMHWWKFSNLLHGLTDDCILNRVRDVRNYDLSTVKDPVARMKILKAQQELALPDNLTQEEQDLLDDFYSQLKQEDDER